MRVRVTTNPGGIERIRTAVGALRVTAADFRGPVMTVMTAEHVRQMKRVFATEGAESAGGKWQALSPDYARRKRKAFPRKKILQLAGDMVRRFTMPSNPYFIRAYIDRGGGRGVYQFGARSNVAAAHATGSPSVAQSQSAAAKRVFFHPPAYRLPVRNMIQKTPLQVAALRRAFTDWYVKKRIPQALRHVRGRT